MIRRIISSLTGRASKSATESAGGGSTYIPLPAHSFPPRVEPDSVDDALRIALERCRADEEMKARFKAQFEKEC